MKVARLNLSERTRRLIEEKDYGSNAGFTIIRKVSFGDNRCYVIGKREVRLGSPYVTWEGNNADDYYWGHYLDTFDEAVKDLAKRVEQGLDNYLAYGE